jgi:lipoate synthase
MGFSLEIEVDVKEHIFLIHVFSLLGVQVRHLLKGIARLKLAQHLAMHGATIIVVNGGGGSHIIEVSNTKITADCQTVTAAQFLPPSGNHKQKWRRYVLVSSSWWWCCYCVW